MKVLNRQNQLVDFDPAKLFAGILKASDNTNESSQLENHKEEIIQGVLDKLLEHGVKHPTTVDINSAIPEVLMEKKFYKTADSFIKYATIHKMERANHKVDPITTIDEYINRQDWRIKANANQGYSVGGMILNSVGKMIANYWFDNVYPEDAGFAHRNGDIHIHDSDCLMGYCFSKDTEIKTKEYGNISMEELERKGHNSIFTVYSKDFNGNIIETKALFARKTRSAEDMEELLEIEFEDGSKVRCTQEHLFMLKDGTYKAAYMLTNMDDVCCIEGNLKIKAIKGIKTEDVYDIEVPTYANFALANGVVVHNCAGWSLKTLLNEGFNGVQGKIQANPPKNLSAAIGQMVNFLGCFTEDTRIKTKEGNFTLRELMDKCQDSFDVIAYDTERKKFVEAKIENIHKTRENVDTITLTFEDGYSCECTLDHKFYTENRGWVEAKDLTEQDEIVQYLDGKSTIKVTNKVYNSIKKDVYCGSVEGYQNFVLANGVVAHNTLQNEWAGAQAFSSFDTYLAPFVRKRKFELEDDYYEANNASRENEDIKNACNKWVEKRLYKEVLQQMQEFIYNLNVPSRWGSQSPFSNVTFDIKCPEGLKNTVPMIGGQTVDTLDYFKGRSFTYGDLENEMALITKCYFEVMAKGDAKGQIFTFPIPTINISKDFAWEDPRLDEMWEAEAKYGLAYFQNFLNSDLNPNQIRSMCVTGDTEVKVKLPTSYLPQIKPIAEVLENFEEKEIEILTSRGYRPIEKKFIYDVNENLVKVTLEDGRTLICTKEHPFLVYNDKTLKIVKSEFLQEGMEVSCNYRDEAGKKASKTKKENFASGKTKRQAGALNGMYGKHHTEEVKAKMSKNLKGHPVSENCRKKSSERWLGAKNPVASQSYWDRKDFTLNNKQISPYEKLIKDELDSIGIPYKFQKIFHDGDKTHVADFYLPTKNAVLELEARCDEKVYINEPKFINKEKFDFYRKQGIEVWTFNAKKCNTYRTLINKTLKITKVEKIPYKGKVYDIEIKQVPGLKEVNDFFANNILTHNCCRLQLDLRELERRGNGLFGSAEQTGSLGVVTLNCARLGYLAKGNKEDLYERTDVLLEMAKKVLESKRKFLTGLLKNGFYPFTKRYLGSYRNHFNTIGVNGINEMLLNFNGLDITTEEGIKFAEEYLDHIREKLVEFQQETGNLYNLEASPAESATYRFAKEDRKRFGDKIIQAGHDDNVYYNNSSQLPVGFTDDVFEALDLQNDLQKKYTGGTVLHIFLGEKVANGEIAKNLVRKVFENYTLPYITLTPTFSICPVHGYIAGEFHFCPLCDSEIIQRSTDKCCK